MSVDVFRPEMSVIEEAYEDLDPLRDFGIGVEITGPQPDAYFWMAEPDDQ